jgi:hypothetical protein
MDWEDVREEVCTNLEIGMIKGETELETITRLIWLERQNNLRAIEKAVAEALDRERGLVTRRARVLQWRLPVGSIWHAERSKVQGTQESDEESRCE